MSEIATAYVQIEPTFKGVQDKIKKELDSGNAGEESGRSIGSKFASGFASVVGTAGKVVAGAVATGSAAVGKVVSDSAAQFAEYEQLVGGVETLFGSSYDSIDEFVEATGIGAEEAGAAWEQYQNRQQTVLDNAANAYQTAGMSANEYMNTVNGFAAALNNSLGEYAWQSANYADMAVGDMADNANKMGTSMEAVQNAYAGFSKGNFTMLDNLKLGYGGTKTEMERLMRDAEQMEGLIEGSLSVDNFADVVDAIHIVQENMGITGTTAREAATTIQGSLAQLQASWTNVLTGMGDKDADLSALIGTLVDNAQTFIGNMLPVVEQALTGVSTMIAELAPVIASELPALLQSALPMLLTSGAQVVETLAQGILDSIPLLMPQITELIVQLGTMLIEMLPQLIQVGAEVILSLAMGIAQALPELIPTIVDVILTITEYLVDNIDLLIDAALQLMIGLAVGLIQALPVLIQKVPEIIVKLVSALIREGAKLLEAAKALINKLKEGISQYAPLVIQAGKKLMEDFKAKLLEFVQKFVDIGKNIVEGIKEGISSAWSSLTNWFKEKLSGLVDGVKDFFKIGSPSKLFADEVGRWIPVGIAQGINDGMGALDKAVQGMTAEVTQKGISTTVRGVMDYGSYDMSDGSTGAILALLAQYLPIIARGNNITLEGDAARLFRLIQREAMRNTQLVGDDAVLSGI
jgi:phage-related protein